MTTSNITQRKNQEDKLSNTKKASNHENQRPAGSFTNIKVKSRIAGLLYLMIAVVGFFSIMYVPSQLVVANDIGQTVANISENTALFNKAIVGDSFVFLFEIILLVLLYRLFKPVSSTLSGVAAYSRMGMAAVMAVNLFNYFFITILLNGSLTAFSSEQINQLVAILLRGHDYGVYIWQIFFALHLVILGYLVVKSDYAPKVLGILMMVGSFGYLLDSYVRILIPGNASIMMVVNILLGLVALAEIAFAVWLLAKGVKDTDLSRQIG